MMLWYVWTQVLGSQLSIYFQYFSMMVAGHKELILSKKTMVSNQL